jgi:DNA-directed RNA polymerase specialized sigma24 family protein
MNFLKTNFLDFINEAIKSEFWANNDSLLLQYYAERKKPEEIARLLNIKNPEAKVTPSDVTKRKFYLKKAGEAKHINHAYQSYSERWSDEELELLKKLIDEKYKVEDIAEILNMSVDRIKSKIFLMSKPKKYIKDGTRKDYYIKKTTAHSKFDTKQWYDKDIKKLVYLYEQGKSVVDIAKEINRTEGAVKEMLTYYKTAVTATRFGENWTDAEIKELESNEFEKSNEFETESIK